MVSLEITNSINTKFQNEKLKAAFSTLCSYLQGFTMSGNLILAAISVLVVAQPAASPNKDFTSDVAFRAAALQTTPGQQFL